MLPGRATSAGHGNHFEPVGQRPGNGQSLSFWANGIQGGRRDQAEPPERGGMTIALATRRLGLDPPLAPPRPVRRRRQVLKRALVATACSLAALIALVAAYVGYSLYKIDHAVHHVPVPASLLAKGKDDLLAIVKGPDQSEQIFVFHDAGGHTNVLKVPDTLGLPLASGGTVAISKLSVHSPTAIIAGLTRIGIPVSRYAAVDLHTVDPSSSLGRLATGKMSVTSLLADPTGASSLLQQVASHVWLGPGTPVSAVMTLMNVPTAHPVSVPTSRDGSGTVVLASAFGSVLRGFL